MHIKKSELIEVVEISQDHAEKLCRTITQNLPEYFGIPSVNEHYFKGVRSCKNMAARIGKKYIGLISFNFPYENNCNIYWMAVLRDHQSKGAGSKLIKAACQFSKKCNASTMSVETLSPTEADANYLKTYQFYQSQGFKPLLNIKPEGYEWNMVYMVKQLANALNNLLYLENDAREFGFDWSDEAMILDQAIDECREIREAIETKEQPERIQEEIGDLLHSAISLCAFAGFDVEKTLDKVNIKFGSRLQAVKTLTHNLGLSTLEGQSIDFMLALWDKAKIMTKQD